jgi:DNA polymerase I
MKTNVLIIDGHNFLFRGYYGVPAQAKFRDGTQINAVYGFFSLLRAAVKTANPKHLIVVFDAETSSDKKKEIVPEYKANRIIQDENIFEQLALIKRCLDILNIYWIEDTLNEADDVIGSFAKTLANCHTNVYICSNDGDFVQLIDKNTSVIKGSRGQNSVLDSSEVQIRYGVLPSRYPDFLALAGDKSDNIPGVKGIGKKYALQLISEYGCIKDVFRSIHLVPSFLSKKLFEQENAVLRIRKFLEINTNLPLPSKFCLSECSLENCDLPQKMGAFLFCHWDEVCT